MNECNIVQDLLPLYADDLASEDSVEFIDRHAANCPHCSEIWRRYKEELPNTHPPVSEEQAQAYQKPIKRGLWKIVLSALATWLILFMVLGYFVWEIGWLGAEKQLVSPDGQITFTVKDYSNAGFFQKGGAYILTPDGQGRSLKSRTDFVDLHVWWASDSSAYFVWWEFLDDDESYYISCEEVQKVGWREYKEQKGIYGVNFYDELSILLRERGIDAAEFAFLQWSDDNSTMQFQFTDESGQIGTLAYSIKTKTIQEVWR